MRPIQCQVPDPVSFIFAMQFVSNRFRAINGSPFSSYAFSVSTGANHDALLVDILLVAIGPQPGTDTNILQFLFENGREGWYAGTSISNDQSTPQCFPGWTTNTMTTDSTPIDWLNESDDRTNCRFIDTVERHTNLPGTGSIAIPFDPCTVSTPGVPSTNQYNCFPEGNPTPASYYESQFQFGHSRASLDVVWASRTNPSLTNQGYGVSAMRVCPISSPSSCSEQVTWELGESETVVEDDFVLRSSLVKANAVSTPVDLPFSINFGCRTVNRVFLDARGFVCADMWPGRMHRPSLGQLNDCLIVTGPEILASMNPAGVADDDELPFYGTVNDGSKVVFEWSDRTQLHLEDGSIEILYAAQNAAAVVPTFNTSTTSLTWAGDVSEKVRLRQPITDDNQNPDPDDNDLWLFVAVFVAIAVAFVIGGAFIYMKFLDGGSGSGTESKPLARSDPSGNKTRNKTRSKSKSKSKSGSAARKPKKTKPEDLTSTASSVITRQGMS